MSYTISYTTMQVSYAISYNQIVYDMVCTMSYMTCKESYTTSEKHAISYVFGTGLCQSYIRYRIRYCILYRMSNVRHRIPNIRYRIRHLKNMRYRMCLVQVFANRIYDIVYDSVYDIEKKFRHRIWYAKFTSLLYDIACLYRMHRHYYKISYAKNL